MSQSKMKARVVDHPNLLRAMSTNAVINTNGNEYKRRLERIRATKRKDEEIELLKKQVNDLTELVNKLTSALHF